MQKLYNTTLIKITMFLNESSKKSNIFIKINSIIINALYVIVL